MQRFYSIWLKDTETLEIFCCWALSTEKNGYILTHPPGSWEFPFTVSSSARPLDFGVLVGCCGFVGCPLVCNPCVINGFYVCVCFFSCVCSIYFILLEHTIAKFLLLFREFFKFIAQLCVETVIFYMGIFLLWIRMSYEFRVMKSD